jgi:Zn-dependent peptidase ImmA (M78 family)/DNA-binding XRE family transcriptional regulator
MKPNLDPIRLGQRLQNARKATGLTQQAVADQLGMARTTLVAMEKGERTVRPEELMALASLYRVSVNELQRASDPLPSIALQFRGRIDDHGKLALEAACRALAEDYLFLEGLRSAPLPRRLPAEVALGADASRAARIAAEDERRRLGLGLEPILSLRSLLEERLGIRVFQFELPGASSVAAVYFYQEPAGAVICVNAVQSWRRRRLSLTHEFGHVIGSRHYADVLDTSVAGATGRSSPSEAFADSFQRHFLMPCGALERFVATRREERGGRFVPNDIVELADSFGVSFEAMCRALEEDGLIKSGAFEYLSSRGFEPRYNERAENWFATDADRSAVSSRFQRLATAAVVARQISEGTLAKLLRVDRVEARAIVRDLMNDSTGDGLEDEP